MSTATTASVKAAGAVLLRGPASGREVLLAHRPAYDDWVLPKGKVEPGELIPATAVREVAEETGAIVRLGPALTPVRYPIPGGTKRVSWWVGTTLSTRERPPDREVDTCQWLSLAEASRRLTYANERAVLAEAAALPDSTALIVLRHAKARRRQGWKPEDDLRPLSPRGHEQAPLVAQLLGAFGVERLIAAPAVRCGQTLEVYAGQKGLDVMTDPVLAAETADAATLATAIGALADQTGRDASPTVVCVQREVILDLLSPLGLTARPLKTAAGVVVHLDQDGRIVAADWYKARRVEAD